LDKEVAAFDPNSGTVAAVRVGVHTVAERMLEQAAESWMAAEREGPECAARRFRSCCTRPRR
jgi:phosphoribosyl-ATP pyrophosphohydrolase